MNKKPFIILLFITFIGLFFRIYPFEAKSWIVNFNTELVNQTLNLGQGFLERDTSFLLQQNEYPYLLSYLLLFGYGIFYLFGNYFGFFSSAYEFISYLFFHLNELYWFSRLLIAVFGALSILLVYLIVRQIFFRDKEKRIILGSLLAAWLTAFSLLSVQFSQQVRPHIVVGFFILLGFYFYLLCLEKKSLSSYLILAISVGLAAGTFISGFFAFVFLILANYFLIYPASGFRWVNLLKSFFCQRFLTGLAVLLIVVFIFYPYIFFNSTAERFSLDSREQGLSLSLGGFPFLIGDIGSGFTVILKGLFLHELTLGLLLVIFLILYFFSKKNQPAELKEKNSYYNQGLTGWWAFVASYVIIFGLFDSGTRYQLLSPLVLFISVGLGALFIKVFDNLGKYKKIIFSLIIILLLFEFVQAFRLVQLMTRPNTREAAGQWIEKNISSSQLIVFEGTWSELILNKESIEVQSLLAGSLSRRNQFLLSLEPDKYPLNSKSMLDFSQLIEYENNDILDAYDFLKEIKPGYFVLSLRLTEDDKSNYLAYQIARKQGHLIKSFSPFKKPQPSRVLTFPSAFDNPFIDLWVSKQLGPTVEIYKLSWR